MEGNYLNLFGNIVKNGIKEGYDAVETRLNNASNTPGKKLAWAVALGIILAAGITLAYYLNPNMFHAAGNLFDKTGKAIGTGATHAFNGIKTAAPNLAKHKWDILEGAMVFSGSAFALWALSGLALVGIKLAQNALNKRKKAKEIENEKEIIRQNIEEATISLRKELQEDENVVVLEPVKKPTLKQRITKNKRPILIGLAIVVGLVALGALAYYGGTHYQQIGQFFTKTVPHTAGDVLKWAKGIPSTVADLASKYKWQLIGAGSALVNLTIFGTISILACSAIASIRKHLNKKNEEQIKNEVNEIMYPGNEPGFGNQSEYEEIK